MRELGDAVVSHHISCDVHKLICEESELDTNDDEILGSKDIAVIHYATLHSLHYLFRGNCYRHDIRGRRSGNDIPEGKKIVLGYKYNDEEMLQIFRVPWPLFFRLVRLVKDHPALVVLVRSRGNILVWSYIYWCF